MFTIGGFRKSDETLGNRQVSTGGSRGYEGARFDWPPSWAIACYEVYEPDTFKPIIRCLIRHEGNEMRRS